MQDWKIINSFINNIQELNKFIIKYYYLLKIKNYSTKESKNQDIKSSIIKLIILQIMKLKKLKIPKIKRIKKIR